MGSVRLPLLAASLCILLFGGPAPADEKCGLAAAYLLDYAGELEFGISIHRCTEYWTLEFEEFGGRQASGEPLWNVLDFLAVPKIASDEVIVSQTCSIGGVQDQGIVVVAQQTDEIWFAHIRVAWRADRESGRWQSVDARTVQCWNEAAGL